MNVKTTITLSEDHLRYAEKLVEDGLYPSISSVVEAAITELFRKEQPGADPLDGMSDEIRRRMELPRDQWVSMEDNNVFDSVRERLKSYRTNK